MASVYKMRHISLVLPYFFSFTLVTKQEILIVISASSNTLKQYSRTKLPEISGACLQLTFPP